jgi:hypothetical protein
MKFRLCLLLVSIVFSTTQVYAGSKSDIGTASGQILKMGAGARAAAMGNAYTGLSNDVSAIYWNPAGLCRVDTLSSQFMHTEWFAGIKYEWFGFTCPVQNNSHLGFGVQYLSYGSLKRLDETGLQLGTLNPSDIVFTISYAFELYGLNVGVNLKHISSKIYYSAQTQSFDIGILCNKFRIAEKELYIGSVIQNIGGKMQFDKKDDPLPLTIKSGLSYNILKNFLGTLDVEMPSDNSLNGGLGAEYLLNVTKDSDLSFRLGYNTKTSEVNSLNGLTTGVGIKYTQFLFDYSFVPYGDLGDTHTISMSFVY